LSRLANFAVHLREDQGVHPVQHVEGAGRSPGERREVQEPAVGRPLTSRARPWPDVRTPSRPAAARAPWTAPTRGTTGATGRPGSCAGWCAAKPPSAPSSSGSAGRSRHRPRVPWGGSATCTSDGRAASRPAGPRPGTDVPGVASSSTTSAASASRRSSPPNRRPGP
jgi:hypothetical protein